MADSTKGTDPQLNDDETEKKTEVTSAIEEKSFRARVFDITIFAIFCFSAIVQAVLSSFQVNEYESS
jgi:hypothetical protein